MGGTETLGTEPTLPQMDAPTTLDGQEHGRYDDLMRLLEDKADTSQPMHTPLGDALASCEDMIRCCEDIWNMHIESLSRRYLHTKRNRQRRNTAEEVTSDEGYLHQSPANGHRAGHPEESTIVQLDYMCLLDSRPSNMHGRHGRNRHAAAQSGATKVCGLCSVADSSSEKVFNRADVFKRHLRSVHGVEPSYTMPEDSYQQAQPARHPENHRRPRIQAPPANTMVSPAQSSFSIHDQNHSHIDHPVGASTIGTSSKGFLASALALFRRGCVRSVSMPMVGVPGQC
ncbi:hypothetical protein QBC34DRAFT_196227 [Podospora aff. communis PSN243]|uniref:C2H2-type domain-containing protein n=1 Tax=Podospora aff. communis PSN243 TaxID=3040156 RepID=A0AAV9G7K3_9PEZI|nr:hypothetical protein QBC34DRAFT_196227 [Podospora aff. communis PSN243]